MILSQARRSQLQERVLNAELEQAGDGKRHTLYFHGLLWRQFETVFALHDNLRCLVNEQIISYPFQLWNRVCAKLRSLNF